MIKLSLNEHYKALPALQASATNTLFAEAVAKNHVCGKIYADQQEDPTTFYICHPYRMAFLCGRSDNPAFNKQLVDYLINAKGGRENLEWLQVYPEDWNRVLTDLLGTILHKKQPEDTYVPSAHEFGEEKAKILQFTRINFKFDTDYYLEIRKLLPEQSAKIRSTTKEMFNTIHGTVAPCNFWDSPEDFEKNGVGFTLMEGGKALSTAFSSFRSDGQLEIGIETAKEARGKGLAAQVCTALIDHCLKLGFEPIWSCHGGNIGSIKLAAKMGFNRAQITPYYRVGF